ARSDDGTYLIGYNLSSLPSFVLRNFATSGIQLTLNAGGVSTANHGTSAEWYAAYAAMNDYVLKSGGTMTGNLNMGAGGVSIQFSGGSGGTGGYIWGANSASTLG